MRKSFITAASAALIAAMGLGGAPALADGHEEAAPELAAKDWYQIVYMKFHAGKVGEAMELIKAFQAVDEALGVEGPIGFHMDTGDWDMMVAFKMEDGIAAMGWASNPSGAAWNAELARQLGGEDKAREHWAKYMALVADTRTEIAHIDTD